MKEAPKDFVLWFYVCVRVESLGAPVVRLAVYAPFQLLYSQNILPRNTTLFVQACIFRCVFVSVCCVAFVFRVWGSRWQECNRLGDVGNCVPLKFSPLLEGSWEGYNYN